MKAVKIYKIQWKTNDPEVIAKLPEHVGFTAVNDYNVAAKVPVVMKKKYGYDIDSFAFTEIPILETVEELLLKFNPEDKVKDLFKATGGLSTFGERCFKNLEWNVNRRLRREFDGDDPWNFPAEYDMIQLTWEKLTGEDWEGKSLEEIMKSLLKVIEEVSPRNIVKKYSTKKPRGKAAQIAAAKAEEENAAEAEFEDGYNEED